MLFMSAHILVASIHLTYSFVYIDAIQNNDEADYSTLMDRFRGRLIVPIFDESGQYVIAFGGRYLESANDAGDATSGDGEKSFTPAKYINSPESLVFTKKNILFNEKKARVAMEDDSPKVNAPVEENATPLTTYKKPPAVIIVEGYFDAIALSNVGIKNVVASMGTALPYEQLKIASEMANVPGGELTRNTLCVVFGHWGLIMSFLFLHQDELFFAWMVMMLASTRWNDCAVATFCRKHQN